MIWLKLCKLYSIKNIIIINIKKNRKTQKGFCIYHSDKIRVTLLIILYYFGTKLKYVIVWWINGRLQELIFGYQKEVWIIQKYCQNNKSSHQIWNIRVLFMSPEKYSRFTMKAANSFEN